MKACQVVDALNISHSAFHKYRVSEEDRDT